jgi:hypothetical protein
LELVDLRSIVREADPKCEELDQPTAVMAVLRATTKLFAPQGEHHQYPQPPNCANACANRMR